MEYLLKASAVIVIFYTCYKLCLQRDTFFEQNRWFLLIGLVTAICIPFVVIPVYVEQNPIDLINYVFTDQATLTERAHNPYSTTSLINIGYLLGVMVFSLRFILQLTSLLPLIIKSKKHKLGRYSFVKTNKDMSPFSFFNYIVYNPELFNDSELEQIISHEKVHVRQQHTIDVLLAQLACIVFWFNPFIWLYNKDLKQNLEFIADKAAIRYAHCKKSYQYTLLKTSMPTHQLALTNNFYNSLIKKRIVMLHKSKSKKINLLKFVLVIPALALFLMSFNTKEVIIEKHYTPIKTENHVLKLLKNSSIEVIITNDFSDSDFDKLKTKFKNEGLTLKVKGIKRNKQGEITAINIEVKSNSANAAYSIDTDEAINPIKISVDDEGKNISIGNGHKIKGHDMVFVSKSGKKHLINHSGSGNNVFVISSDNNDVEFDSDVNNEEIIIKNGDSIHIKKRRLNMDSDDDHIFITKDGDRKKKIKVIKIDEGEEGNDFTWSTDEDEDIVLNGDGLKSKVKIISTNSEEKPLIFLNGKEINSEEMEDLEPSSIDNVQVIKGEKAIEKYGDNGKNGVVVITTKK